MVGVAIGNWINNNKQQEKELAELKQQVDENRRVMMAMLAISSPIGLPRRSSSSA